MTRGPRAEAALASAAVVTGLLLPLTLLGKLQSLSMYLTHAEVLQAYGTAWILHLPVAALAGLAAFLLTTLLPRRFRASAAPVLLSSGFFFALFMGARPLLDSAFGQGSYPVMPLAAATVMAGVLFGLLLPERARGAMPVAAILGGGGLAAAVAALLLAPGSDPLDHSPAPRVRRPDILLVTIDTLANAHLSSMGYARTTTPNLDRLAAQGVQFSHLVASSNYTTPTLNTLMSGRRPWSHKAFQLKSRPVEQAATQSLPALLHREGYALRAVSTNPYGGIYKNGYGRFFEEVRTDRLPWLTGCSDTYSRVLPYACPATEIGIIDQLAGRGNVLLEQLGFWPSGRHMDARVALHDAEQLWQAGAGPRPLFLWVHLFPPHDPYLAPAGFLGRFDPSTDAVRTADTRPLFHFDFAVEGPERQALLKARYDEAMAAVDADVGGFLARQKAAGRLGNTVVIVTADHGESFRADYGGHGGPMLHGAVTRIPLIIVGPGLAAGRRVDTPVEQTDIPRTIAALAGAQVPPSWEGRSLLPALAGGDVLPRPVFAASLERSSRFGALRSASVVMTDGHWTYVHYRGLPALPGYDRLKDGLFDNRTDSEQTRNLAANFPARAAAMRAAIQAELLQHEGP